MALKKGTNSYRTVAEADAYFEDRLDVAAWTDADDDQKSQSLVTATAVLDNMDWTGYAVSESQNLAFPRVGTYFDPRLGYDVNFDSVDAPDRINIATYELAYHLLNNDGLLDSSGSVVNLKVGPISLERVSTPSTVPPHVKRLIKPMLVNSGAKQWWRAN